MEQEMLDPNFWRNKELAQSKIRELQDLKNELEGFGKYDRENAIISIFSGAGGDDAEDWTAILMRMYINYADKNNYKVDFIDENQNSNGGYRSVTFEIIGKNAYQNLKKESGVHRLVRISPFNANQKRQTSFSMVEVIPNMNKFLSEDPLKEDDLLVEYTKSSGPGGQNVNKRETAVRVIHKPTNISVLSSNQRSQIQNKEKAIEILKGKLVKIQEEQNKKTAAEISVNKNQNVEWGSQIRSYVMHPYQLVKDHRISLETNNIKAVLDGDLELFISALKDVNI